MLDLKNANCTKCELCKKRKNVVNGLGAQQAKIMLIGEWPGSPEDRSGDIWSGPIGFEVKRILGLADIDPKDVYMTNVVRCVPKAPPPIRIRQPKKEEIEACADYLDQEIANVQPNIIVPMGTLAVKRIFGTVATIKNTRGAEMWSTKYNCKIIPVFHPMALRRYPQYVGFTVEDFRRIGKSANYPELTKKKPGQYMIVDTLKKFETVMQRLHSSEVWSYDIETSGLDFTENKVLSISFSWKEYTGVTVPLTKYVPKTFEEIVVKKKKIRKKNKETGKSEIVGEREVPTTIKQVEDGYENYWGVDHKYIIENIKGALENPKLKIAQNGKFDNSFLLKNYDINVHAFDFDTMLAHYLLDENAEGMHGLKDLAWIFTDMGGYEDELKQFFKGVAKKNRNYAKVPPTTLYTYAAMDADCTLRLYNLFAPRLVAEGLVELNKRLIMPLSQTLMEAEMAGMLLDKDYNKQLETDLTAEVDKKQQELMADVQAERITMIADGQQVRLEKLGITDDINFNSSQQLAKLFFQEWKWQVLKKTPSQKPSCDEEVLTELAKNHTFPKKILEYRYSRNMLSKYVIGLAKRVDMDWLIHTTFLIHGTVTGRLSSSDPNLQNIPNVKTDKRFKNQFIPHLGYIFIEADYGQVEFRFWANYSQDQDMTRDIIAADNKTGPDIHIRTASEAWGVPLDQVTTELRQKAKTVVFGIMYGRQADSIATECDITPAEAQKIIDLFLGRYPVARLWLAETIRTVQTYEQIRTVFGRLRRLPGIKSPIKYVKSENERLAMNSPIQSAASDLNCNAANKIRNAFRKAGINGGLRNLVHDSVLFEVRKDHAQEAVKIIRREMEAPVKGVTVPMKVEIGIGDRWGEIKELTKEDESKIAELVQA